MGQVDPGGRAGPKPSIVSTAEDPESANGSARLGDYLRRLREGYGYTLRKVEERAMALGEVIDNSQLSRFEKGKAVPSFDKLRALARVFNVPVQNFSDVLDLEEYQAFKPTGDNYAELLHAGHELMGHSEHGRAYVTYERALDIAEALDGDPGPALEMAAEARWRMACALKALGKLHMTERELREILKQRGGLGARTRLRTLLQLSYLYRELGDLYLAGVLARECHELAEHEGDHATEAGVLNTLGNIAHDEGETARALECYERANAILAGLPGMMEMKTTLLMNLGGCLVGLGRFEEGMRLLDEAHAQALAAGSRKIAALSLTRLAEGHLAQQAMGEARRKFAESDTLAARPEGSFHDVLFLNSFHRWMLARQEGNGTGERIAFGRLRHLRSLLQRRFPEVDVFDRYVEGVRG